MNQLFLKISLIGILFFRPIMPNQCVSKNIKIKKIYYNREQFENEIKNLENEIKNVDITTYQNNDLKFSDVYTPILNVAAAGYVAYIVQTYLVQENYKVSAKYPHAQAWYDAIAEKYPVANLKNKLFLQRLFMIPAKFMTWFSDFNYIYFPQNELIRINSLYGLLQNKQIISQSDQEFLSGQEFLLLHEAGHIEHKDIYNKFIAQGVLAGLLGGVIANKKTDYSFKDLKLDSIVIESDYVACDFDFKLNYINISHRPIIFTAGFTFMLQFILSRYNEYNADKFAYNLCDDKALAGGIAFFESEKIDPMLHAAHEEYSPFIQTDSVLGSITQSLVTCFTGPFFHLNKTVAQIINSSDFIRWLYDLRHLTHPGNPARVALMRAEQNRRAQLPR